MDFTQEQQEHIDNLLSQEKEKWITEELNPLQQQVEELEKFKPVEKTDKEIEFETKEKELFEKEKALILKENDLQQFADFFVANDIEELNNKITNFKEILNDLKIDNSYKPTDHKQTDKYSVAKENKDALGMIKALFK